MLARAAELRSRCRGVDSAIRPSVTVTRAITVAGLILSVCGLSLRSEPFSVTNIGVDGEIISLQWQGTAAKCIVAKYQSLEIQQAELMDPVVAANSATVSGRWHTAFFRIRTVAEVDFDHEFPDPVFRAYVRDAIPRKYHPTNEMYDIDLLGIRTLMCVDPDPITNLQGIALLRHLEHFEIEDNSELTYRALDVSSLSALRYLNCNGCDLTQLNLSGCTNLAYLECWDNNLEVLDISTCTNLSVVYAQNNPLREIIVWDLDDLPVLVYTGDPMIREP